MNGEMSEDEAREAARRYLADKLKVKPSELEVGACDQVANQWVVNVSWLSKKGAIGATHQIRIDKYTREIVS
jgi:hypothetical protein